MRRTIGIMDKAIKAPHERTLTSAAHLAEHGLVKSDEANHLERVTDQFGMAITPAMASLIDPGDPDDPIAKQFVPSQQELNIDALDIADPIGDQTHAPVTGIVHRYPDRVLLMPLRVCPVYCRFCFRRETIGSNEPECLSDAELETALGYIRQDTRIWEVILSGGDPLILSPRRLRRILNALHAIDHVQVIRIHSRVPVVDPARIDDSLIAALKMVKPVYLVLHTNHPRELTTAARSARVL